MSFGEPKNTERSEKAPRSWFKILLGLFLAVVLCLFLLLALLPTLVSSSWGKERIETLLNAQIPGKVKIGDMSLSWFGPQKIYDVSVHSPEGQEILTVSQASTSASIFNLWKYFRPNDLDIQALNAVMEIDASGSTNFERTFSKSSPSTSSQNPVVIELKDTNVNLDLSGAADRLIVTLSGNTVRNGLQGQFSINGQLDGIDSNKIRRERSLAENMSLLSAGSTFKLNGNISNFPVALIAQFLSFERPEAAKLLAQVLGEDFQEMSNQGRHVIDGTVSADIAFADQGDKTPRGNVTIDLKNNLFSGKAHFDSVSNELTFNLQGRGEAGQGGQQGRQAEISLSGKLVQVLTPQGNLNPNPALAVNGAADGLPVPLLCELFCSDPTMSQKIQILLGDRVNIETQMQLQQMNGPIYLVAKGSNGNFFLDGSISNGHLRLNRNFEAQVAVTPELGKYLLSPYFPILGEMVGADNPVKLTIGQQDFDFPIYTPNLANISLGQASLELGKIYFANNGTLAKSLKLLAPSSVNFLSIWFTPTYFTLSQGVLKMERVDMLVSDHYPFAAWGHVDFLRDRVNMMLGLSGATINKVFNVSGVQNKYMLQLPLRGTLKDASIDKSKVAARVSAIVAQSHGGPQGLILGTILDVASGGLTEANPPPPTTNPLPWANQYEDPEDSNSKTTEEQSPKSSKSKNPLKQIGKEATNLLKEIFR